MEIIKEQQNNIEYDMFKIDLIVWKSSINIWNISSFSERFKIDLIVWKFPFQVTKWSVIYFV